MRKAYLVSVAFVAVLVAAAFGAAGASATLWLLNGRSITSVLSLTFHLKIILRHLGGTVGASSIECDLLFDVAVGPNGTDLISKVLNLTGTEEGLIKCTSSNPLCKEPLMHALNLPWHTELLLIGSLTWDDFMKEPGSTGGEPGWDILCSGTLVVDCTGLLRVHFDENLAGGALFLWKGAESEVVQCTDGGDAVFEQPANSSAVVLGFTVS